VRRRPEDEADGASVVGAPSTPVAASDPAIARDPVDPRSAAQRSRAASALLLERAHLLLPLASQLGDGQPLLESAIHGSSMSPAIPARTRLRVRVSRQSSCEPGDVIFYLADGGYTVHRVVCRVRRTAGPDYLLTAGDARFAPDRPVPGTRVLGVVVAAHIDGHWQAVGPPVARSWYHRVVRAITLPTTAAALRLNATAATRLADGLLALESFSRLALGRLRHLRRGPAGSNAPSDVRRGG
jgi:hypothetical protein